VPIERYLRWRQPDGRPFDPWLRLHVGLGGTILKGAPRSLRINGTLAQWESWTDMLFPESDDYVFPRGLATLVIDRETDLGRYFEPDIWVQHKL
jgi:hypothetical protein